MQLGNRNEALADFTTECTEDTEQSTLLCLLLRWRVAMRIRIAACLVAMLMAGAGAFAQTKDVDIPYQKFVLDNGLTLIVHEDHKAPIVAINTWYHVGSKNEKLGKTGFAHLFEHLMFGGSDHAKGSYIEAMERIGATDLNGTTNNDRTNYFENVPTSAVDYALWMESDRMGFLTLDQKTLDLQRGVVQNEKRQGENQPYAVSRQLITQNTYPAGHPYSWTVIGDMGDLNAAAMDDVKEWFKTYYGPSNVVIVMAGDIDAKTAKQKVEKYFGNIPAGPPVGHQQVWVAKMTGTHRQVVQDRVPQARIYKVWNIPEYGNADSVYLDMVSDILSVGKTSRFYKRLIYDDQIATGADAGVDLREIGGQFHVQATARPGQGLAQVEKELDEELARFLKEGPTAEELQRVKTQNEAQFIRGIERIGGFVGKSDRLAQSEVFRGSPDAYKDWLKLVRGATAEDLKAAANRWLADGVYILEVLPFPSYKTAAAGADRSKAPEIGTPPTLKLPKLQRAAIDREKNTPVQMALRVFPELLYGPKHAYGNPLTGSGTSASVTKMTREDLAKFHDTWIRPNDSTLIVVGDTTIAELTPKLEKYFAGWKAGKTPAKNVGTVQQAAKSVVYLVDKPGALQSVIIAGHVAPPTNNPKEIAIEAMNDGLGGNFAARLNMNLREDKHWSYGAQSLLWAARGQRPFIAYAPVQTDKTKESLAEMNKELQDILSQRPLTAEELEQVQASETLSLPGSRETIDEVAQSIADLVHFGLPDDYYETFAGKVRALKTSDVNDAAKMVVHPDNMIWVVVGDRAKVEAGIKELNLGELRLMDADGKVL